MFSHILVPTDGSDLSLRAIEQAVQLAKRLGAKVTGFHVVPEFHTFTYQAEMLEDTHDEYLRNSKIRAGKYLDVVRQAAAAAGVPCEADFVMSNHVYEAIIDAATRRGCDLILMASHGRRGVQGLLLGSETQKVLTHSKVPVLVYR